MRTLPFDSATFDVVISWFTSFGYFDDDENRRVLDEAQRVLKPGGRLAIEINNLAELLPRLAAGDRDRPRRRVRDRSRAALIR